VKGYGNRCCKPLCLWLFILVAIFLRVNKTLSEALPLVSLTQGDNSFFIYSSPTITLIILLPWLNPYNIPPWHNPSVGKPTAPLKQGRNQVAEKPEGLLFNN
jgi:hypothetical protein